MRCSRAIQKLRNSVRVALRAVCNLHMRGFARAAACCEVAACIPPTPHTAVLLSCGEQDGGSEVLAALCKRLASDTGQAAVQSTDVDELQDVAAMREQLRQAQLALCERWRHAQV